MGDRKSVRAKIYREVLRNDGPWTQHACYTYKLGATVKSSQLKITTWIRKELPMPDPCCRICDHILIPSILSFIEKPVSSCGRAQLQHTLLAQELSA